MNRTAALILLLISTTIAGAQQAEAPFSDSTPGFAGSITPILYDVRINDSQAYLYGSIHAATADATPPPRTVRDAFSRSDRLITEVLIETLESVSFLHAVYDSGMMPSGVRLEEFLDQAHYRLLLTWADEFGMDPHALSLMRPWLVELMVNDTARYPEGFSAENGLDIYFSRKATAVGMPKGELESAEEQLGYLAAGSHEEQAYSLSQSLEEYRSTAAIGELYRVWRAGDEDRLAEIVRAGFTGHPFLEWQFGQLFTHRNQVWAERLSMMMDHGEILFVVVGAGHLVGDGSLQDELRKRGAVVERIR